MHFCALFLNLWEKCTRDTCIFYACAYLPKRNYAQAHLLNKSSASHVNQVELELPVQITRLTDVACLPPEAPIPCLFENLST